jgi:hypothetical protein
MISTYCLKEDSENFPFMLKLFKNNGPTRTSTRREVRREEKKLPPKKGLGVGASFQMNYAV